MRNRSKLLLALLGLLITATLVGGYLAWRAWGGEQNGTAGAESEAAQGNNRAEPVVVTPVELRLFEERVDVQGTLEARETATVSGRTRGVLEKLCVDEGDYVQAGKTRLFQVDALTLEKAVDVSRQDLSMAKFALEEKEALLEKVEAELHKAKLDLRRAEQLYENNNISVNELEQQQSRYKQVQASRKHAQSLVELAREKREQAHSALDIARKNLSDATVYAPIDGHVSLKLREAGEMVEPGKPVMRIEDTANLEVSVYLPAQYYHRVVVGETPVRCTVHGIDVGEQPVSQKSSTVDPMLRTFEVKCTIDDPPDGVVPGAMVEAIVVLDRRRSLAVPSEAVQERGGRQVVFTVEDDRAAPIPVETGLQNDGYLEIEGEGLREGMPLITMGQYQVEADTPVTVQEGAA